MRASVKFLKMAAQGTILDGVFAVNKPKGMSSAQVIRDAQQQFNPSAFFKPMIDEQKSNRSRESNTKRKRRGFGKNDIRVKMGHGGTLDPLATGVLIIGVGNGTKTLQSFLDCTKSYETVVLFGASTDTYDRVGKVLKKTAYDHITRSMVQEALESFKGKIQQLPPIYSALKMEGKPLYEYAREGKPIPREIALREVEVTEMELVEWYEPGTHNHRWPAEEATTFDRNFAEQVFKMEKAQTANKKLTPEEEEEDSKALEAHERFKRKADESIDALVYHKVNKRRKTVQEPAFMSGALGEAPPPKQGKGKDKYKGEGKGSNLVPPPADPNTPPPWDDIGPPAAKIRMTVTSGFYVRSFCHDLGVKVGSAGLMAELCRSRQGDFVLGGPNCLEFSDLEKGEDTWAPKVASMLTHWSNKAGESKTQPPTRARQNQSPKRAQESPEQSSPQKRKSLEKDDASSGDAKPTPPDPTSPVEMSKEKVSKEAKIEAKVSGAPDVANAHSAGEEEEWNGFGDSPVANK